MVRNIFALVLVAVLAAACRPSGEKIPEPDYNPYLLKPGKYLEVEPRVIPLDSLPAPVQIPARSKRIPLGKSEYKPAYRNTIPAGQPEVFPVTLESFETGPMESFEYIPSKDRKVNAPWPKWKPAQTPARIDGPYPLFYLGIEQGLNHSTIRNLIEDQFGRIWIGKENGGVSVWDGTGFMEFTVEEGLPSNIVFSLLEDSKGRIWIGTAKGICFWDGSRITRFSDGEDLTRNLVNDIIEDRKGNIWISAGNKVLIWIGTGFFVLPQIPDRYNNSSYTWRFLEDINGNIWIGGLGLVFWDGLKFNYFPQLDSLKLNVRSFLEDHGGNIWVGTYRNGPIIWTGTEFVRFCPENKPEYSNNQKSSTSDFIRYNLKTDFRDDTVWDLMEDDEGRIFIGTQKNGLYIWDGVNFTQFTKQEKIGDDFIRCLLPKQKGGIYIGTSFHGVTILDDKGLTHFTKVEGLSDLSITGLSETPQGQILVSTESGGLNIWEGNGFKHLKAGNAFPISRIKTLLNTSKGHIWEGGRDLNLLDSNGYFYNYYELFDLAGREGISHLLEDQIGEIWIGADNGLFNFANDKFNFFSAIDTAPPNFNAIGYTVNGLLEDRKGNIWFSSRGISTSLIRWDKNNFLHFSLGDGPWKPVPFNLLEDSKNRIWAGTNDGLFIWDGTGFTTYTTNEGLKFNHPTTILIDHQNNVWAGTNGGGGLMRLYETSDGLAVESYSIPAGLEGISYKDLLADHEDNLWMATDKGLLRMPIQPDTLKPTLMLREVQPFFDQVDWRMTKDTISKGGHPDTGRDSISLARITFDSVYRFTNLPANAAFPHNINQLTFSWSGLHTRNPEKLLYSYFLEGQDRSWSPPVKENKASYINLPPGGYTFKVRAVNGIGIWSDTASYAFTVRAPWYWSWWSKTWYGLLLFSGLFAFYRFQLNRRLAAAENARLIELDKVKTRLYTNITHEFRTPLTVIEGMIGQMEENPKDWFREGIAIIRRNCSYLLYLVNQLLDLRKLESGKMKADYIQGDLIPYLRYIAESFDSLAGVKQIEVHFISTLDRLIMDYDPEKLLHLVSNLLSNAVKFTPDGGNIYLMAERIGDEMRLRIQDTGIGIPPDKLSRIFERFYQVDDSATRKGEGTGVGLALVWELVGLFSGRIEVNSTPGKGTEFTVWLPIRQTALPAEGIPIQGATQRLAAFQVVSDKKDELLQSGYDSDFPLVLIVEDNMDVIRYLRACLQDDYRIEAAHNGREGIEKALELLPDIVISDVMMPEKDGYELSRTLKKDLRTSHIPIVLLTAKADLPSKIEGLEMGADEYLPKPFHKDELEVRIRKLIELRKQLQHKFGDWDFQEKLRRKSEKQLSPEERFLQKALKLVEENLSDEDFGLEQLRKELLISRTQLHRKIKALTGDSTTKFIRNIRLQKARELLITEDLQISEIAYRVGFKSLAHFSQSFSEKFGVSPTDFRKGGT